MNSTGTDKQLYPLYLTIFIDLLGIGIIIPVLAALFFDPSSAMVPIDMTYERRALYLGLITALYPLFQFFGAPIVGTLSDRVGRKKMLVISLVGTGISYVLFALGVLTHSLALLFISRSLAGLCGGNISVAQSAIADLSTPETRAKNFGMIGMAYGLGFIFGPFLGGKLADSSLVWWFSAHIPFWFSAALAFTNTGLVIKFFKETNRHLTQGALDLGHMFKGGARNIRRAWSMKSTRSLFVVSFFFMLGFSFFTQFFQVYLINRFGFTERNIGNYFAYAGVLIALVQGFIVPLVARKKSSIWVLGRMPFLLGLSFILLASVNQEWFLVYSAPFVALAYGLSHPNLMSLISSRTRPEEQGEILGINQSVFSLAQMIPPLISAYILTIADTLPIVVAGIVVLVSWVIFLWSKKPLNKDS